MFHSLCLSNTYGGIPPRNQFGALDVDSSQFKLVEFARLFLPSRVRRLKTLAWWLPQRKPNYAAFSVVILTALCAHGLVGVGRPYFFEFLTNNANGVPKRKQSSL